MTRDGVGEGQFAEVLLREMDALRKACQVLKASYLPRVTMIVVQKRHHTRFFPADAKMRDRKGNMLPGTVVDTQICHPSQYDFYLCSHASIQGTRRPAHYHVLFDENHFTADQLQLFTNSLRYLLVAQDQFPSVFALLCCASGRPQRHFVMVGKRPRFIYRILQEVLRNRKCLGTGPLIAAEVKENGFHKYRLAYKLVQHLCINCDVDGALLIVNRLKETDLFVAFPIDVLVDLSRRGRALDVYKFVVGAQDSLPAMNVVLYSVIIDSLCKDGYVDEALALCALARKGGVIFGVVTYNIILNGLCRQGCLIVAFRLFDSSERQDTVPTEITYGTMIDASVREGYLLVARELFERMVLKSVKPTTHIYNAPIGGYCKMGDVEESLKLLDDLDKRSLKSDEFTVSAIIDGFSRLGDMEGALQFFIKAREKGNSPDFLGFLYLIRGLYTEGRMEEARSNLREMLQTDASVELINRIDVDVGNESVYGFLVSLCEQGIIHEAVIVLSEIAVIIFPYKRSVICSGQNKGLDREGPLPSEVCMKPLSFYHERILDEKTNNLDGVKQVVKFCDGSGERTQLFDFDVLHAEVEALRSAGDVAEASKLIKEMICRLPKDHM